MCFSHPFACRNTTKQSASSATGPWKTKTKIDDSFAPDSLYTTLPAHCHSTVYGIVNGRHNQAQAATRISLESAQEFGLLIFLHQTRWCQSSSCATRAWSVSSAREQRGMCRMLDLRRKKPWHYDVVPGCRSQINSLVESTDFHHDHIPAKLL